MSKFAILRNVCGLALASLSLAIPVVSQAQSGYTIIDLGVGEGLSINASGQVAGNGPNGAALWAGTTRSDLGGLGGKSSGSDAINDRGQVTGYSYLSDNFSFHAVVWTLYAAADLGTLGGTGSQGYGINATGQVAGYSYLSSTNNFHAALWNGTAVTDLGTLGGYDSVGNAINASGQVAGWSLLSSNTAIHAVRWTGTTATDLGTLGGNESVGNAINKSGQVAGSSYLSNSNNFHAVRWTGNTATDLGTLGGASSQAYGMNASGAVVGYSQLANGTQDAMYTVGNTMLDLNTLLPANSGWLLTDARGINDNGWITGQGTINGQFHAFILRPNAVPEPSALAVFGIGAMAIGMGGFGRLKSLLQRRKVRLRGLHTQHKFPAS